MTRIIQTWPNLLGFQKSMNSFGKYKLQCLAEHLSRLSFINNYLDDHGFLFPRMFFKMKCVRYASVDDIDAVFEMYAMLLEYNLKEYEKRTPVEKPYDILPISVVYRTVLSIVRCFNDHIAVESLTYETIVNSDAFVQLDKMAQIEQSLQVKRFLELVPDCQEFHNQLALIWSDYHIGYHTRIPIFHLVCDFMYHFIHSNFIHRPIYNSQFIDTLDIKVEELQHAVRMIDYCPWKKTFLQKVEKALNTLSVLATVHDPCIDTLFVMRGICQSCEGSLLCGSVVGRQECLTCFSLPKSVCLRDADECPICLEEFSVEKKVLLCGHVVCHGCVQLIEKCPLCRAAM